MEASKRAPAAACAAVHAVVSSNVRSSHKRVWVGGIPAKWNVHFLSVVGNPKSLEPVTADLRSR